MGYFALLSKGSQFHKAEFVGRGLKISRADESPEYLDTFQRIVSEAEEKSMLEGYEIETHRDPGGGYDFALLWFNRPPRQSPFGTRQYLRKP